MSPLSLCLFYQRGKKEGLDTTASYCSKEKLSFLVMQAVVEVG